MQSNLFNLDSNRKELVVLGVSMLRRCAYLIEVEII